MDGLKSNGACTLRNSTQMNIELNAVNYWQQKHTAYKASFLGKGRPF
ncbi:hypothetical protein SP21_48 [Salmonella phage 21]|nr:hypothetical protein SP21_48 [Salmonella phage 21]